MIWNVSSGRIILGIVNETERRQATKSAQKAWGDDRGLKVTPCAVELARAKRRGATVH